ncbi:MAG: hypothetical protein K9N51_13075, partial [Candidatus Pacebacteria bacterium]|nr:hypothetical protein [Candidatus Paceibacterota bacterium]
MKKELASILDSVGISKMIERRRKLLSYILLGSLAAHLLGLIIFGSVVVMRAYLDETTVFTTPPPSKTYEPRKLEHRVKVQKRQRSSSRPSVMPRLAATKPSDLALPEIAMDPKVIRTSFQPKFKAVTGTGLGVGVGT